MLITFEGLDRMGKSTLIKSVAQRLQNELSVYLTKEPGSSLVPGNAELRKLVLEDESLTPIERELLFYVDASKHRRKIAEISNEKPSPVVLSDRGYWSHIAYLHGYEATGEISFLEASSLVSILLQACAKPTAIVYLRGSLDLMKKRARQDEKLDMIESKSDIFFQAVNHSYNELSMLYPEDYSVLILNAEDPVDSNTEKTVQWIKELYEQYKSNRLHRIEALVSNDEDNGLI